MKVSVFYGLEPKVVWQFFEQICSIPHPSKKEEKIAQWIVDFAKERDLDCKKDRAGNILISKPATMGYGLKPSIILQSHMDMVCEKNREVEHDFDNDPIIPYVENGWIKARGTTLGADNGIGVAMQLAVLASDDVIHGPLECLFTVDEETGLTGAFGLEKGFFKSKYLINLDSEGWKEIFIGCAGGRGTTAEFEYIKEPLPEGTEFFQISVTGLKGGHSGDEIHKGIGNSIKIINRLLMYAAEKYDARVATLEGGNLHNAIPREAFATICVPAVHSAYFKNYVAQFESIIRNELSIKAPDLKIRVEKAEKPEFVIDLNAQTNLLRALSACPHGELAWSVAIPDLVETSTNLATVKMKDKIVVGTSQRSSIESAIENVVSMVRSVFLLAGAKVSSSEGYPGWEPKLDSAILKVTSDSFRRLFHEEPEVKAIHAGLECGLIGKKYPGIDMVSIGPTLQNVHSPDEKLEIKSTQLCWEWLLDILKSGV